MNIAENKICSLFDSFIILSLKHPVVTLGLVNRQYLVFLESLDQNKEFISRRLEFIFFNSADKFYFLSMVSFHTLDKNFCFGNFSKKYCNDLSSINQLGLCKMVSSSWIVTIECFSRWYKLIQDQKKPKSLKYTLFSRPNKETFVLAAHYLSKLGICVKPLHY
jgi:hypothetical protein